MSFLAWGFSVVVLAVAAALRAAGASLVRTSQAEALHDAAEGNRRAEVVAKLLEDRAGIQPSISLVHSILLVTAVIPLAWSVAVTVEGWTLAVSLLLVGAILILVGELLPRTLGRSHPRKMAYRFSRLLAAAIAVGGRTVDLINDEENGEEEDEEQDRDEADREEIRLISSVLEFSDALVREVLVPRTDMVTLKSDSTLGQARDQVLESGFSRIPVTGQGEDDIVGVLYAKDLLEQMGSEEWTESSLAETITFRREPFFVPETKTVRELLREMQATQVHLAIVLDEFGGTAGLVTIEDLIEELVGEIADEYDVEMPLVQNLGGGTYIVDARLSVDDFNEMIGGAFPDEEWDTVGGLVLGLAGRLPKEGEHFEYQDAVLTSERVQGRRIEQVRVQIQKE